MSPDNPIQELEVPSLLDDLSRLLNQIPRGRVTTYGDLAEALGDRHAARWVGEALLKHTHSESCPCHRVVRSTGDIGRYITGNSDEKHRKLQAESIVVQGNAVNLSEYRFSDFQSDHPLLDLRKHQERIGQQVSLKPYSKTPSLVAGVDVSYSSSTAVATLAIVETQSGKCVDSTTVKCPISFPYISGYLAFRELPVLVRLMKQVAKIGEIPKVILVDGNGILHHRTAGIASHLGVVMNLRTIGVGKTLLGGTFKRKDLSPSSPQPIFWNDRQVGIAVVSRKNSTPIFISPGHRIDVESSLRIVQALFHGHRLPEPLYWADRLSRQTARKKTRIDGRSQTWTESE
ncbi:MAG: hypothetical protein Tsb009_00470 [Planctomycetaceae bacterium]